MRVTESTEYNFARTIISDCGSPLMKWQRTHILFTCQTCTGNIMAPTNVRKKSTNIFSNLLLHKMDLLYSALKSIYTVA